MANGLKFSPRKTSLALAVAVVCAWQSPVFAHGSEAHMVPLDKSCRNSALMCSGMTTRKCSP